MDVHACVEVNIIYYERLRCVLQTELFNNSNLPVNVVVKGQFEVLSVRV